MSPLFDLGSALAEAAIIAVVFAVLFTHREVRATVLAAPRALRIGSLLAMSVWLVSQLAEIRLATYPFMSWHMYGESRRNAPVVGYRITGEHCDGTTRVLPNTGGAMGRRPLLASGLRRAYNDVRQAADNASERASALARTDSLLQLVVVTWNDARRETPLCAVSLQQLVLPAEALTSAPLPPYHTVRRYAITR